MPKRQDDNERDVTADPDGMRDLAMHVAGADPLSSEAPSSKEKTAAAPGNQGISEPDKGFSNGRPSEDGVDAIEFMILAFGFEDIDMVRNTGDIAAMPDKMDLRVVGAPAER